jgi:hypothetical protein
MTEARLTIKVCLERRAPDGSWAPESCYAAEVAVKGKVTPANTLSAGHAAQRAAEEIRAGGVDRV